MSDTAYAKVRNYTWDDAFERFEAALRTAVERSKSDEFVSLPRLKAA
jgi:hypothetical protein